MQDLHLPLGLHPPRGSYGEGGEVWQGHHLRVTVRHRAVPADRAPHRQEAAPLRDGRRRGHGIQGCIDHYSFSASLLYDHFTHYYTVQQISLLVGVKHFFQNIHAICGIMRELNSIMPPKYVTNCGILDFSTVKMPTVKMPTVKMPTVKMPRFANRGIMDFSTV